MKTIALLVLVLSACAPATGPTDPDPVPTWGEVVDMLCTARCERRAECGVVEVGCHYGCVAAACKDLPTSTYAATCEDDFDLGLDEIDSSIESVRALTCRKAAPELFY